MNIKKKKLSVMLFGVILALVFAMLVAVSVGCGENDPSGEAPDQTTDKEQSSDTDAEIALASGARYEAEYAVITGTPADGKKGYVGSVSNASNKYALKRLCVPGNVVTFTVTADKAEDDVALIASIAAMNYSTSNKDARHREAEFDSVYTLSVNGDRISNPGLKYTSETHKEHWFDFVEVRLTIDLKAGENTITFTVPEPVFTAELAEENPSLCVGANFDYIYFETASAKLTYAPNYNNAFE